MGNRKGIRPVKSIATTVFLAHYDSMLSPSQGRQGTTLMLTKECRALFPSVSKQPASG